jgi:hypothetical protein
MPRYSAFGGCLRSEIEIPDLPLSRSKTTDWSLTVAVGPPAEVPLELLGEHKVGRWVYRLFRAASGLRLEYDGTYVFDIRCRGAEIVWYPTNGTKEEFARALLLGPVLALAHHVAGALCLHGSAVAIGGRGVAFLASKYHGKSTLGLALVLSGARQLTDDALVVDATPEVRVRPGVHSIRLWNDSAQRLGAADLECVLLDGVKNTLTELPRRLVQRTPVPLASLYLLRSVLPGEDVPVAERIALSPALAAVALTHHTKLPLPLLGPTEGAPQFLRAAAVARSVPVYELRVVRDFDRLPEVVQTIFSWHQAPRHRSQRVLAKV